LIGKEEGGTLLLVIKGECEATGDEARLLRAIRGILNMTDPSATRKRTAREALDPRTHVSIPTPATAAVPGFPAALPSRLALKLCPCPAATPAPKLVLGLKPPEGEGLPAFGRPPGEVPPPVPVAIGGLLEGEWEGARALVLGAWAEWLIWLALPPGIGRPRV
jgi:hypothetical protein